MVVKKYFVLGLVLGTLIGKIAFAEEVAICKISQNDFVNSLSLPFDQFDQNMDGGWRKLANQGCEFEAGQLIDIYHLHHQKVLLPWQDGLLYWHAGQLYAFSNIYPLALNRFESSYSKDEDSNSMIRWNAYVAGSIAFLKGDLEELKRQKDLAALSQEEHNLRNVRILEAMIRCFGRPYREAYNSECK